MIFWIRFQDGFREIRVVQLLTIIWVKRFKRIDTVLIYV